MVYVNKIVAQTSDYTPVSSSESVGIKVDVKEEKTENREPQEKPKRTKKSASKA